jgi:hypothetical protein
MSFSYSGPWYGRGLGQQLLQGGHPAHPLRLPVACGQSAHRSRVLETSPLRPLYLSVNRDGDCYAKYSILYEPKFCPSRKENSRKLSEVFQGIENFLFSSIVKKERVSLVWKFLHIMVSIFVSYLCKHFCML